MIIKKNLNVSIIRLCKARVSILSEAIAFLLLLKGNRGDFNHTFLTCVCSHVPLQVESVVESFATKATWMSLYQAVALQVAGQHALQGKDLVAHRAPKVTGNRGGARAGLLGRHRLDKVRSY